MNNFCTRLLAATLLLGALALTAFAQTTPAGTLINNQARVTYDDGNGGSSSGLSPLVALTVANVAGLAILPDGATAPAATVGTSGYLLPFTVTNTGNFSEPVIFPASGQALQVGGSGATLTRAVIDVDHSGTLNAGDIDILTNGTPVSYVLAQSATVRVLAEFTFTAAGSINVSLGDGGGVDTLDRDNQPWDSSARSIYTDTVATAVNSAREAAGDYGVTAGGGIIINTAGLVFIGPLNTPTATGPASQQDDFTNKSQTSGVNAAFGSNTTAGQVIVFQNTVRNDATLADVIALTAPSVPAGFTVEASLDGVSYSTISGGASFSLGSLAAQSNQNVFIRVTAPAGLPVLAAYPSTLRVTSGSVPANFNETIDRVYTGFVRLFKTATVNNTTGTGGATDAVAGAVITYTVTYANISSPALGSGNATLTASNVVVVDDGTVAPSNWATSCTYVLNSLQDPSGSGGVVSGNTPGSTHFEDAIPSILPGNGGVMSFQVRIN